MTTPPRTIGKEEGHGYSVTWVEHSETHQEVMVLTPEPKDWVQAVFRGPGAESTANAFFITYVHEYLDEMRGEA